MGNEELIKALVNFQKEIINPANTAVNPFFKSSYAPLPDILNLVRPILSKNGLYVLQNTGTNEEGMVFVQTVLHHCSGESLKSDQLALKPDKPSVQGIGSAITYGRRYQLSAMLGISSEDDDDANSISPQKEREKKPVKKVIKKQPKSSRTSPSTQVKEDKNKEYPYLRLKGVSSELFRWAESKHSKEKLTVNQILIKAKQFVDNGDIQKVEFEAVKKVYNILN